MFENDAEIFQFVNDNLYVAAVCDILDSLGYRNQAMHQRLRPLLPDIRNCGFVGRARTFRWMEIDYVNEDDPYGLEIEAMDALGPGDVVVHSTDHPGTEEPPSEKRKDGRTLLRLHPRLAPIKCAVLPLVKKDPWLTGKAREIVSELYRSGINAFYDEKDAIGRRYAFNRTAGRQCASA